MTSLCYHPLIAEALAPNQDTLVQHLTTPQCVLATLTLASCLICIYMVFFFGRRLQTGAYLRDSMVEGAKQQELKPLMQELRERAMEGPLDTAQPPPKGYNVRALWGRERYGETPATSEYIPMAESPEQRQRREESLKEERQWEEEIRKWGIEEKARFEIERKKAEDEAQKRAEKKIPMSMDISLLGGGWAFLLEFSTVIVIIFALLILGILQTLDGKEISTILAAIAGYVLGKASGAKKEPEQPNLKKATGEAS